MQQTDTNSQESSTTTTTTAPLADDSHFTSALKEWVEVDNKIAYYNQHLKECRQVRNQLTPSICNYMERQSLQNTKIQISDGSLHYGSESITPSFSQKFLMEGLTAFFDSRMGASQEGAVVAKECMDFLKSRRVPETKTVLKRKYTNASS